MRAWRDDARDHARRILTDALHAVTPQVLMRTRLRFDGRTLTLPDGAQVDLRPRGKLRLLAMGKAAGGMAAHAQPWGPYHEAVVIAPHDAGIPEFECLVGDHPEPTERSVKAGVRALELARATGPDDVLLVLISGGASALAEAPAVPLDDLRRTTGLLLDAGADITELNTVRRHLSQLKNGGLLRESQGRVVLLALSDVAGDDPAVIGSGPATPEVTSREDAAAVLDRFGLTDAVSLQVRQHLRPHMQAHMRPHLRSDVPVRVTTCLLASNLDALSAAAATARALGYEVEVAPEFLRGEARERGRELAARARERASGGPFALIAGGEATVRVVGSGRGGRNQEAALAAVDGLSSLDALLACLGTDGVDGPTDAAGAIVDGTTRARADSLGLDAEAHLQENDAYAYFDALRDLIRTGPTGTNVRDVAVLLCKGAP